MADLRGHDSVIYGVLDFNKRTMPSLTRSLGVNVAQVCSSKTSRF